MIASNKIIAVAITYLFLIITIKADAQGKLVTKNSPLNKTDTATIAQPRTGGPGDAGLSGSQTDKPLILNVDPKFPKGEEGFGSNYMLDWSYTEGASTTGVPLVNFKDFMYKDGTTQAIISAEGSDSKYLGWSQVTGMSYMLNISQHKFYR